MCLCRRTFFFVQRLLIVVCGGVVVVVFDVVVGCLVLGQGPILVCCCLSRCWGVLHAVLSPGLRSPIVRPRGMPRQ